MAYAIKVIYDIIVTVSNQVDIRPVRPFTAAVAREIREIMKINSLTQGVVAKLVNRDQSYISERVSGKRPFTTDEIDAIAELIGIDGSTLLAEIACRLKNNTHGVHHEHDALIRQMSEASGKSVTTGDLAIAASQRHNIGATRKLLTETD
jgi:transcriptional regulator with XRE-family HTH domain